MLSRYRDICIGERRVHQWVNIFKNQQAAIYNEQHSSSPSTTVADEEVVRASAMICENSCISWEALERELDSSIRYAHTIVKELLKCSELSSVGA